MARFTLRATVTTTASSADALDAGELALKAAAAGPRRNGTVVAGALGSNLKARLWGSKLAKPEWLPVTIAVAVRDRGEDRLVSIDVSEDFGFGTLAGAGNEYRRRCQQVAVTISDDLVRRLPDGTVTPPVEIA
jgi:hypothetical protein